MIGPLLVVAALLQGAAAPAPAGEVPAGQAPPSVPAPQAPSTATSGGTVLLKVGDYDLNQFISELKRGVDLIEMGSESMGLEVLDKLAAQSSNVRRVRTLVDIERPEHGKLFVERAKGYLSTGSDQVEESLRELWRVNPFFRDPLPPRLQQTLDAILSRDAGTLEISSPVRGALLLVDGALAGSASDLPQRVRLLAGEVEVRAKMDGFPRDDAKKVTVVAQAVVSVSVTPRQIIPPVVLLSDRPDIKIAMTGGAADLRFSNLAGLRAQLPAAASQALDARIAANGLDANSVAGFLVPDTAIEVGKNLNLTFSGTCLVDLTRTISVTDELLRANESQPLLWLGNDSIVRPQPDVGTLRVSSTPVGAEVFVNDQPVGSTPIELSRCAAASYKVRVRHRKVGSFGTTTAVTRGRTVAVDVPLKPGIAFLGAVDTTQSPARSAPDLKDQVEQTATATLTTFRAADQLQVSAEVERWSPQLTVALVGAVDRNDATQIARLLNVANANFEAPLMVAAVRRSDTVELFFLWSDHTGVDRVRWSGQTADLAPLFTRIDAPLEGAELVYQNDIGIRFADTALPGAPILIVRVDDANGQLKVGEHIEAVDGMAMSAQGLADRVRQRKLGDLVTLRVSTVAAAPPREVRVTVARKPRRAPIFDPTVQGNVLIAKLSAAGLIAPPGADRELFNFSLAAAYMRFGGYKVASELLAAIGNVPAGAGVGRGPAAYLRARALEALGDRDGALAEYKKASDAAVRSQVFADDGAGVGTMADRHLAVFGRAP